MKTVWITGASSGIGKALAVLLAAGGYRVLATARNAGALAALAAEFPQIVPLPADLANADDVAALRSRLEQLHCGIDILVVNAGTCLYMDEASLDMSQLEQVFRVNVFAAASTIDLALPWLKRSPYGGHIIGISSMSVYLPFTRAEYYGASKAAFTYYLQSLAIDLKPLGIAVSIVYPGFVDTPLTQKNDFPMPFMMTATSAAQALLKVIEKRPATAAFPEPLHYLLRILGIIPGLWGKLHKRQVLTP